MIHIPGGPCRIVLAAIILAGASSACRGDDAATPCGPIVREPLDPAYLVHVLGAGDDVHYATDPPTSGPHKAGSTLTGVLREPLARPLQVGILERGDVLIQHDPRVLASELARLEALAGAGVIVAPNPDLADHVVATAWTYSLRCSAVDVNALRTFIRARRGRGPDG